jgi:hypothetical protein
MVGSRVDVEVGKANGLDITMEIGNGWKVVENGLNDAYDIEVDGDFDFGFMRVIW